MGMLVSAITLCLIAAIFLFSERKHAPDTAARKELRTNFMREILTFDPRIADDSDSLQMSFFLFSGLTCLDEQGNAQLDLAESYKVSEDQKTYWFTLKKINWSDGTPLTAYDFEESWKEYSHERFPASLWEMVSMIKNHRGKNIGNSAEPIGITALDAQTVQIQLEQPTTYFLQLLAHPTLFPVHHSMRGAFYQHKRINPCDIVCCGPFKIQNYKDQVEIVLQKNPHSTRVSSLFFDSIHFSRITDPQTVLALFEKGHFDWLGLPLSELPLDALSDLKQKGLLQSHPLLDARFLYFNTKQYPFTNVKLRKALTLAIDRQGIIQDILQSNDQPALGYVPFAQKRERWQAYFKDRDEKEARELFEQALQELHISASEFPEIALSYNTSETWRRVIQAIQEQWRKVLGIRVKIENSDWQVHMDNLRTGHFQIARGGRTADFVDSLAFLQPLLSFNAAQNFCKWENTQYDELVQSAEMLKSPEERSACLERAEAVLMEEMPIAPLMYFTAYSVSQEYVKGVVVSPLYYVDFSKAYFTEKQ